MSDTGDCKSSPKTVPSTPIGEPKVLSTSVINISNINNNNNKIYKNKVNNQKQQQSNEFAAVVATKSAQTATLLRKKYVKWSWRILRRKQILAFLGIIIVYMLYINSVSTEESENQERIPVVHYSHVPGMKATNYSEQPKLQQSTQSNIDSVTVALTVHADLAVKERLNKTENNYNISSFPANFLYQKNLTQNAKQIEIASAVHMNYANDVATNNNDTDGTINVNGTYDPLLPPPSGYLVWSERCKMPNIDPYLPEVMKFFKREKYKPCLVQSVKKPLTSVAYSESTQRYVLRVNDDLIPLYSKSGVVDCCYHIINRNFTGINADKEVSLSDCITFKKSTKLAPHIDNIIVKCRVKKKQIYVNGHAMMPERKDLRERLDTWRRNDTKQKLHRPPSVLMIGIDSISRINLIRAMPKTAQYLYNNEWFEMSGYNKIDDNTFPNLMAVLTGLNKTHAYLKCSPTTLNALDNCNFVWRTFRDHGYVTAYGEDEAGINTFNYLKVGFERPPVDYYLRPFLLSAEKHLHVRHKSSLIDCLGYQHAADFVYEYAIELARRFKNDPFFGLFWANTFSHNAISDCSAMDENMVNYLKRFAALGTFENTIVIFFSDHGIRFGPTRATYSGHLEERLPFMFIWLPQQLKQLHPKFVNALSVNKNRLTNPYDLHMTLKHVLRMSGRVDDELQLAPAEDCARCQTLLEPVPHNRSCEDIAIEAHWCTCIPYQSVYKNSKMVQNLAKHAVSYINNYVADFRNGSIAERCTPLKLKSIQSAYRAQPGPTTFNFKTGNHINETGFIDTYRLIFQTKPNNGLFEATVLYGAPSSAVAAPIFEVTGEISRLNSYSSDSDCIEDGGAKKYCSCRKLF